MIKKTNMDDKLKGNILKCVRLSRGFSQIKLAEKSKIAQGTISKIEMGILEVATETLELLADALKYPVEIFDDRQLGWSLINSSIFSFHRTG